MSPRQHEDALSPAQVFLTCAVADWDALGDDAMAGPEEVLRWERLRRRLGAFIWACSALEARANEVQAEHGIPGRVRVPEAEWRTRPLEQRVGELVGEREMSRRRQRLLRDVEEFRDAVLRPRPARFVEQLRLDDLGRAAPVLVESAAGQDRRYRPADLPGNPLNFGDGHLRTALLVLLEHVVLLDRRFERHNPLTARRGAGEVTAPAWFEELRGGYQGPHAAYFQRIRPGPRS
ncbi:MAG: hypothetical protein WEA24_11315 [Gemmatimonadota bacterium]